MARVNGEEISEFRLERFFAEYLEDQGRAVASIRSPRAYKQLRQAALDALIDKELLWQESHKRGRGGQRCQRCSSRSSRPARPSAARR